MKVKKNSLVHDRKQKWKVFFFFKFNLSSVVEGVDYESAVCASAYNQFLTRFLPTDAAFPTKSHVAVAVAVMDSQNLFSLVSILLLVYSFILR